MWLPRHWISSTSNLAAYFFGALNITCTVNLPGIVPLLKILEHKPIVGR